MHKYIKSILTRSVIYAEGEVAKSSHLFKKEGTKSSTLSQGGREDFPIL